MTHRDQGEAKLHQTYARWLEWGNRTGLALLFVSFLAYAFGWVAPLVPLDRLPAVWRLPVGEYVAATGAPTGWGWLERLDRGDYLTFVGVAVLGAITAVCYARMLVLYLKRGERWYAALSAAQIAVLLVAACGLLAGGR